MGRTATSQRAWLARKHPDMAALIERYVSFHYGHGSEAEVERIWDRFYPILAKYRIRALARELGKTRPYVRWSDVQIAEIFFRSDNSDSREIASRLGRSVKAVEREAQRLGLKVRRESEDYTFAQLQANFGVRKARLQQWIDSGWLVGEHSGPRGTWRFSYEAVCDFVRAHWQDAVPPRWLWLFGTAFAGGERRGA